MADEDELGFSVTGDTKGLDQALGKSVDLFNKKMRAQFEDILNTVGAQKFFTAPATKSWTEFPQYQAHRRGSDTVPGGQAWVTSALMSGFAKDVKSLGVTKASPVFQNAMVAAGAKGLMPDNPYERVGMLRAYGLDKAASYAHPDTPIGSILAADYEMLKQPWAQGFIKDKSEQVPVEYRDKQGNLRQRRKKNPVTGKLEPVFETVQDVSVDFDAMREFAVERGFGRWKDESAKKTAENFELINDALEDVGKNADKSDKIFLNWNDTLKGVLGTLTAISGVPAVVAGINKAAEAGVKTSASVIPNTLPFYGMDTVDYLRTKNASLALNLGPEAVYSDIGKLAGMRSEFKTFGTGLDPIFSSLTGVFNTITEESDPVTAYKKVAQALTDTLRDINAMSEGVEKENIRSQYKMLIDKMGIGTFGEIAGALNKPTFSARFPDVESLFQVAENPYYGALEQAKVINAEIEKLNTSIGASYSELYNMWEERFGLKFKGWWDSFLKNWFVPMLHGDLKDPVTSAREVASINMLGLYASQAKDKAIDWLNATESQSRMQDVFIRSKPTSGVKEPAAKGRFDAYQKYDILSNYSNADTVYQFKDFYKNIKAKAGTAEDVGGRYLTALNWLDTTGFGKVLTDLTLNEADKAIVAVVQRYLLEGNKGKDYLKAFEDVAYGESGAINQVLQNLANSAEMLKNITDAGVEVRMTLENTFGDYMGSKTFNLFQNQGILNSAN